MDFGFLIVFGLTWVLKIEEDWCQARWGETMHRVSWTFLGIQQGRHIEHVLQNRQPPGDTFTGWGRKWTHRYINVFFRSLHPCSQLVILLSVYPSESDACLILLLEKWPCVFSFHHRKMEINQGDLCLGWTVEIVDCRFLQNLPLVTLP